MESLIFLDNRQDAHVITDGQEWFLISLLLGSILQTVGQSGMTLIYEAKGTVRAGIFLILLFFQMDDGLTQKREGAGGNFFLQTEITF